MNARTPRAPRANQLAPTVCKAVTPDPNFQVGCGWSSENTRRRYVMPTQHGPETRKYYVEDFAVPDRK